MDLDPTTARLIDANLNRAREGIRVLEELARLALDDPALAESAKRLRHELRAAFDAPSLRRAIRCRDIKGDVGTALETPAEYLRSDLGDVATAAAKRVGESLRVLEECAKTVDPVVARTVEQLRYRSYELERKLTITRDARVRFAEVRLYVIITESECHHDWYDTAAAAIDGGADCIQLREKTLPDGLLLERGRQLHELCASRNVLLVINDRPDIARIIHADGVHLGQDDMSVVEARRIVGPGTSVGLSTHNQQQIEAAIQARPDYIAIGPMFPTTIKPQSTPLGPEIVRQAMAKTGLPIVPIGGIDREGAERLAEVGARCVCACRAVIASQDPAAEAASILKPFSDAARQ